MIRKLKEKRGNSPSSVVLEAAIIIVFMVLAMIILWWACLDDFTTNTVPVRLFWFTLIPGAVLYPKHFRYCYDMQHWTSRTMYMEYWNWIKWKEIVLFWRTLYLSAKLFTALRLRLCTRNTVSWIIKRSFEQFLFQRRFISRSRISTREKGNKIWKFAWTSNTDLSLL